MFLIKTPILLARNTFRIQVSIQRFSFLLLLFLLSRDCKELILSIVPVMIIRKSLSVFCEAVKGFYG